MCTLLHAHRLPGPYSRRCRSTLPLSSTSSSSWTADTSTALRFPWQWAMGSFLTQILTVIGNTAKTLGKWPLKTSEMRKNRQPSVHLPLFMLSTCMCICRCCPSVCQPPPPSLPHCLSPCLPPSSLSSSHLSLLL